MNHNRIMITGTNSGSGKTTITCAIIKALKNQNKNVVSFKTGPDYVDPMFHNVILNNNCRNLDMFFHDKKTINHLINKNTNADDIVVIEGVMGFYDGLGGISSEASSYDLARITKTPTILIVNGSGVSVSLNAMIKGFLDYKENNIVGIIINNISAMFYQTIKPIIEEECQIELLGYLEYNPKIKLDHRYLGLLMPHEITDIEEKINKLAMNVTNSVDLKRIEELSSQAALLEEDFTYPKIKEDVTIGIVYDEAFCFYYQDNLELLEKLGAKLVYFSLLNDNEIPENIDGLIIGGGYPELFIKQLSENKAMIASMKNAVNNKLPIFAEGAGFIYLGSTLNVENTIYPLTNIINMEATLTKKLQPFGYITNEVLHDNIVLKQKDKVAAHEFHYVATNYAYNSLKATKPLSNRQWLTGYYNEHIFAGFSHYHFYSNINMAINFLKTCSAYKKKRGIL